MSIYLLRRLLLATAVTAISVTLGFVMLRIVPGDPFGMVVEQHGRSRAALDELRARNGLDQPIVIQYADFVRQAVHGDFGTSLATSQPVITMVRSAFANSLLLGTSGLVLAAIIGISVGALQGWRPHSLAGRSLGTALTTLYAAPEFIVAILLMTLLAYRWTLFPAGGVSDPVLSITGSNVERLRDAMWHLVLPSSTLALGWGAAVARQQRQSLLAIAGDNHVRSARAKGVSELRVFGAHALRPSLPAVVVVIGLMLPEIVGGAVVIEMLFGWPGLGSLMLTSIAARDYPVVSAGIVATGILVSLAGLATDAVIAALDPRARGIAR